MPYRRSLLVVYFIYSSAHYIWPHVHCICVITPTLPMISQPLYVWYHILYMCDIAQCLYLWHHKLYDVLTLYGITHSVMTTQPLCLTSHPVYLCRHTPCTNLIKTCVCMTSQPLYIWQHIHSLWHHTTLFITWSPLYLTSHALYLTSRPLYLCHHTHTTDDITATPSMISRPVYMWHPILYI